MAFMQYMAEPLYIHPLPQSAPVSIVATTLDKCAAEVSQVKVMLQEAQEYVAQQKVINDQTLGDERAHAAQKLQDELNSIKTTNDDELNIQLAKVEADHTLELNSRNDTITRLKVSAVEQIKGDIETQSDARLSNFVTAAEQRRMDAVVTMVRAAAPVAAPLGLVPIDIDGNGVQDTTDAVTLFIAQTMQGYGASMLIQKYWGEHPQKKGKKTGLTQILSIVERAVSEIDTHN
jgi:hypothetical protein